MDEKTTVDSVDEQTTIDVINVDEDGNEIENIDWSKWKRVRVGEITNELGEIVVLMSHCRKLTEEELNEALLMRL